jgi:hypothetical protein
MFQRGITPPSSTFYELELLVTTNFVPSSVILFTLMMEAIRSSDTSVLAIATCYHIPE